MRTTVPTAWPTGAPSIGDRARSSRRVTERDIALFTEISGDRNPIHYDAELAAAQPGSVESSSRAE